MPSTTPVRALEKLAAPGPLRMAGTPVAMASPASARASSPRPGRVATTTPVPPASSDTRPGRRRTTLPASRVSAPSSASTSLASWCCVVGWVTATPYPGRAGNSARSGYGRPAMTASSPSRWSRRRFLGATGAGVVAVALGGCQDDGNAGRGPVGPSATTSSAPPEPELETLEAIDHGAPQGPAPFGLGVASGDPDHESVVLWTWVDRDPSAPVPLLVEVARDDAFEAIVAREELRADPAEAMTARIVVRGLAPDTRHWFRFVLDGHVTPAARTRTAPAPGALPDQPLRVGHLSCQRWSSGYWTALDDVAAQAPDVVVHCGDYVYESDSGSVRPVDEAPPTDLDGYRALWRRYKAEPELQAAHAVAPWLITWDDHEVVNNYQGAATTAGPGGEQLLERRAAAYRAWWEFTPTRLEPPEGPDLAIHRVVDW
ncbi:MAG TPA: hypothetical protein DCS55_15145, partial [Acidimicrobiaceae bacterium]|nr:hypothetical protein [Acidimicrobiaceae bacterium]